MEQVKKIIVPIDFSVKSLTLVKEVIESAPSDQLFEIILLHGVYAPTSITDLLFHHPSKYIKQLETEEFNEACGMLKNKFQSRIKAMYIDVINSDNKLYFQNYIHKNQVDEIFIPKGIELNFKGKYSFNLIPLLKKARITITEIQLAGSENYNMNFTNNISDLFLSHS